MYCVNDDTYGNRAQKFTLRFNTLTLLAFVFGIGGGGGGRC